MADTFDPRGAPARAAPARRSRLAGAEIAEALAALPGWSGDADRLMKVYRFDGWRATISFVDALAALADDVDHHPDLVVGWGRCEVVWRTHDAGGVTRTDLACAVRTDALAGARNGRTE